MIGGFISEIHLNIAKDLKKFLPKIFGNRNYKPFGPINMNQKYLKESMFMQTQLRLI